VLEKRAFHFLFFHAAGNNLFDAQPPRQMSFFVTPVTVVVQGYRLPFSFGLTYALSSSAVVGVGVVSVIACSNTSFSSETMVQTMELKFVNAIQPRQQRPRSTYYCRTESKGTM
jgi:hypothetical protein